jgi:hypothetical protein
VLTTNHKHHNNMKVKEVIPSSINGLKTGDRVAILTAKQFKKHAGKKLIAEKSVWLVCQSMGATHRNIGICASNAKELGIDAANFYTLQ